MRQLYILWRPVLLLCLIGAACTGRMSSGGMRAWQADSKPNNGGSSASAAWERNGMKAFLTPQRNPSRSAPGGVADEPFSPLVNENTAKQQGFRLFRDKVQGALADQCGSCHLGSRFSFASLRRAGEQFTEEEGVENYRTFFAMLSLDNPRASRLLTKVTQGKFGQEHGGGAFKLGEKDPLFSTLLEWIETEAKERCSDCGIRASRAFIAYLDQPAAHWAMVRSPTRKGYGFRRGAKIMMQPIKPATGEPVGAPVPFLPDSFCGPKGECDFGHMSASYAGDRLVFECRLSPKGRDWLDLTWNVCIAEIGKDGRAVHPRFVRPESERHEGWTYARSDPFLVLNESGFPAYGDYDKHARLRKLDDEYPIFTPSDTRIIVSSRSPDPRTGTMGTTTYHGVNFTNNIISMGLNGENQRTLYFNEGGTADSPLFMRNGNLVIHVWNLDRMDRHLYIQATQDGMMELPVLFGRTRGTNMWGKMTELAGGSFIGIGGRRRGSVERFEAFYTDHTLGTGIDSTVTAFRLLDPEVNKEVKINYAYCSSPPKGENCSTARFYEDASYSPYGGALITYNDERTYYKSQGIDDNAFQKAYGKTNQNWKALEPWLPALKIATLDPDGTAKVLLRPPKGRAYRYPAWVGKRQPPLQQPKTVDETQKHADLHIADFPLWLSMRDGSGGKDKRRVLADLDKIVAVRVMTKIFRGNACTNDGFPYRHSTYAGFGASAVDHPTHLGIVNATGFLQYEVPPEIGGDGFGNVRLQSDNSVFLRVPAGELLLFQGVDAAGHMVEQHSRLFAMPPGVSVDTSVRRGDYRAQCMSCHGQISGKGYLGLKDTDQLPATMSFDTEAKAAGPINLMHERVTQRPLTFLGRLRPLFDKKCVSCHDSKSPAGELTLVGNYSPRANYPAGKWARAPHTNRNYLDFVPEGKRVPGYAWSNARAYALERDRQKEVFITDIYQPLSELSPWDPGYQMLWIPASEGNGQGSYYLSDYKYAKHIGRGGRFSDTSYLLEVLTGRDMSKHHDSAGTYDHTKLLSAAEIRTVMALIDNGMPYMGKCADRTVPSGPHKGKPWGDPEVISLP